MYKWVDGGESRVKHLTPVVGISGKYARKIWMNCSVLVLSKDGGIVGLIIQTQLLPSCRLQKVFYDDFVPKF